MTTCGRARSRAVAGAVARASVCCGACGVPWPPASLPAPPAGAARMHYVGPASVFMRLCANAALSTLKPAFQHFGEGATYRLPAPTAWNAVAAHFGRALPGWRVVDEPEAQMDGCRMREWATGRWFWERRVAVVLSDRGPAEYQDEDGPFAVLLVVVPGE